MKKLFNSLLLILMLSSVASCKSDLDSLDDGNHRSKREKNKPMIKTVRMSFGGDFITESEEPLMRAEEGETYAAINVWRTENVENAKEEKYAYGLFKKKDGISLEVVTGYKYRFEATIVIDYIDKYELRDGKYYTTPFRIHTKYLPDFENPLQYDGKINDFVKSYQVDGDDNRKCFCQLYQGAVNVNPGADHNIETIFRYPRVKRFYGNTEENFDPEKSESVIIPMNYKSFGLQIDVVALPSGYVTIEDVSSNHGSSGVTDRLLFTKDLKLAKGESWNGLYSLYDLTRDSETFKLEFTWHKGGGVTESFIETITVNAKTNKILKLKIDGSPSYETKGNIILEIDTKEFKDEQEEEISHDFNSSDSK